MAAAGSQPENRPDSQHRLVAGRYRLRAELGAGSMGTVWAGYDEFLHRPVAVKGIRLPPGFPAAQAEEQRERALREARAIASLSHPNVITLYDVVREDGEPFVVMELLQARSLAGLIADNGPLSLEQAAEVGDAVAAALEAAHAAGITHRDVKPGNVLVSRDGRIKLTDFGIARNVSDITLTKSGLMLGSPAYMAPELASGRKVSPAADLWGLGATLFTALDGEPPYDADGDPLATASAVVHGEVPQPSPGPLAALIGSLMSKDPALRPDLAAVRDTLFDLRPQPGRPLFDPALFDTTDTPAPDAEPAEGDDVTEAVPAAAATGTTAPLAADPGPLPFDPGARRTEPRPVHLALFAALAVAAFLIASVGGFALTRTLAGANVLPAASHSLVGSGSGATGPLVTQRGNASFLNGDAAGRFQIDAPAGWTRFVTQQQAGTLPASTLVQFVSPNGHLMVGVERFPEFFPGNNMDFYLNGLRSFWPADGFVLIDGLDGAGDEGPVDVTYRTIETPTTPEQAEPTWSGAQQSSVIGRTTFARLSRVGSSLWVERVTVPTEQESRGKAELFERIVPTFEVG